MGASAELRAFPFLLKVVSHSTLALPDAMSEKKKNTYGPKQLYTAVILEFSSCTYSKQVRERLIDVTEVPVE